MTSPTYARRTPVRPHPAPGGGFHSAPTQEFHMASTQTFHTVPTQAYRIPVAPPVQPPAAPAKPPTKRKRGRGALAILLILVIVLAIAAAGLVGAEFYARAFAVDKIKSATACFIEASEDSVDVTFETSPPVLMQYLNDKYTGFTIATNGSRIRSVEGITGDITVSDLDLNGGANGQGTVGAISANVDWTSEGMRESANNALKEAIDEYLDNSFLSFLSDWISTDEVVTNIQTDPSTGIVTLEGMFDSTIAVKPEKTTDGGIRLEIQPDSFSLGGGLDLPQEDLQEKLDEMTSELTNNEYHLRVDSLEVTAAGVVAKFSATNVDIPASDGTSSCLDM
ncbi:DUF2993 domain-containing protein [Mycobacterium sp. 2YAF39]|uniref:LmeA family phospholipid-binding protein n=1 Tax=Mycobacterium sp. 2YAF39 TaxID=3233033 RepID=UPI003F9C7F7C